MSTVPKKFGFLRTTLALWGASLFAGRAGVVTDSTPGPVERWGWYDGSAWKFSARSGANESFGSLVLSSYIVLNGATRPAWGSDFSRSNQLDDLCALAVFRDALGSGVEIWSNAYYNGTNFIALQTSATNFPTRLSINKGMLTLQSSATAPTAGGVISDMTAKFRVSKEGGCGFFGVSAPTVRPTVNAAATDLATVIALTNQLRTHLIACGLVQ